MAGNLLERKIDKSSSTYWGKRDKVSPSKKDCREPILRNKGVFMSKLSTIKELWEFMKVRKKWWLPPIIIVLLLLGIIIVFTESTPVTQFIYTAF